MTFFFNHPTLIKVQHLAPNKVTSARWRRLCLQYFGFIFVWSEDAASIFIYGQWYTEFSSLIYWICLLALMLKAFVKKVCSSSSSGYSHWTFSIAPEGNSPCCIIQSISNSLLTACRRGIGPARGKESKLLKCFVKNSEMYHSKLLSITPSAFGLQSSICLTLLSKEGK